jgi:hypothetical protein
MTAIRYLCRHTYRYGISQREAVLPCVQEGKLMMQRIPNRADFVIVWVAAGAGLLLPWATAGGVKVYLQELGKPTWPWSSFAGYAPVGLLLSVVYAAPFYGLALVARSWALGRIHWLAPAFPLQRRLVVLLTLLGGAVGMVRVFVDVFWVFDPMVLFILPLVVLYYLPWMGGGLVLGVLAALFAVAGRRRPSGSSPRS